MGRHYHFRLGSFYRADDRTGFPQRAEHTRAQWNRLIVDESVWEPRQPQDLVKGVRDQQSVKDARPPAPPIWQGPLYGALTDAAAPLATVLTLETTASMTIGDELGIMLDNGVMWNVGLLNILPNDQIQISAGLPFSAASGNVMVDYLRPFASWGTPVVVVSEYGEMVF